MDWFCFIKQVLLILWLPMLLGGGGALQVMSPAECLVLESGGGQ